MIVLLVWLENESTFSFFWWSAISPLLKQSLIETVQGQQSQTDVYKALVIPREQRPVMLGYKPEVDERYGCKWELHEL